MITKRTLSILLALVLLLWPAPGHPAHAADGAYYIAPTGNDAANCTLAAPCATLTRAGGLVRAGDTLFLRGGVYRFAAEQNLTLAGTVTATITIASYPGESAVLDAQGVALGDTQSVLKLNNSAYVTVRDIEIRNSSGRGLSVYSAQQGRSHHIFIEGVTVRHVGQRGIGGSGDDITISNSLVEYAAEDNTTNGSGGGWAAGVSSYQSGDGKPARRWTMTGTTIRLVRGECAIALNVQGFTWLNNTFESCYNIYIDKAIDGLVAGNVVSQTLGWGKFGEHGDGFKLANENSNLITPAYVLSNITLDRNSLTGVQDCFSYWQDTRNASPTNTYARISITNNECHSLTGSLLVFNGVGATYIQPVANVFQGNTCAFGCSTVFGDANDQASWTFEPGPTPTATQATPVVTPTVTSTPAATPETQTVRFAVIGDFGHEESGAADDVARLIDGWGVDFIATVGDNCYYPAGDQMDRCVGQFYHHYIFPYVGSYGAGSPTGVNRFIPTMGNHEYEQDVETAYWRFFTLPGNERYYTLRSGPVELFMLNSNAEEPDGNTSNSPQAVWARNAMQASDAVWKFVFWHHPGYSTGSTHGGSPTRRWPFAQWGADAVFAGHEHNYERIFAEGIVYFVNGLGGRSRYTFSQTPIPGSQVRYGSDYGAQMVECSATACRIQFITRAGQVIDDFTLNASGTPAPTLTRTPTRTPSRTPTRTVTRTRTATWTATRTPSPTLTTSSTPVFTPSATASPSQTVTESPSPTSTGTNTPTLTITPSPTSSLTATPTLTITPTATPVVLLNHYGLMGNVASARSLGVGIMRVQVFADEYLTEGCIACENAIAQGLVLNVTWRANGGAGSATTWPTDYQAYSIATDEFLDRYGPYIDFITVENEANSVLFWTGTIGQYAELLRLVCDKAHTRGVKCSTDGTVWKAAAVLTHDTYYSTGQYRAACSFAWRVFGSAEAPALCDGQFSPEYLMQVEKVLAYIDAYATADIDYLNLHVYGSDYYSVAEVANQYRYAYCQRVTPEKCQAVKLVVNEWGDRLGKAENIINTLTALHDVGAARVIYWNFDRQGGNVALTNSDGTLRLPGLAFRTWLDNQ